MIVGIYVVNCSDNDFMDLIYRVVTHRLQNICLFLTHTLLVTINLLETDVWMTILYSLMNAISNDETFLQDSLVILKQMLQNSKS